MSVIELLNHRFRDMALRPDQCSVLNLSTLRLLVIMLLTYEPDHERDQPAGEDSLNRGRPEQAADGLAVDLLDRGPHVIAKEAVDRE